jgi:hypothetical protein
MPRKSAAALSVLPMHAPPKPLAPPPELTKEQCRIWREVVGSRPPDFFDVACSALLVAYVRHAVRASVVAKVIEGLEPGHPRYRQLSEIAARETGMLVTLAAKLRLAPAHIRRVEQKLPQPQTWKRMPWEPVS